MNKLTIPILLFALSAQAVVINLGIKDGGPSSIAAELEQLNYQISTYSPPLPLASGGIRTEIKNGGSSLTLNLSGFDGYMVFKWGERAQFYYIFDDPREQTEEFAGWNDATSKFNGFSSYTFYSTYYPSVPEFEGDCVFIPRAASISHYTVYEAVPESGSTFFLFSIAVLGFAIFRKLI